MSGPNDLLAVHMAKVDGPLSAVRGVKIEHPKSTPYYSSAKFV